MAKKELSYSCYIIINGADPVPWDSLTEDEKENIRDIWSERLSRNMSDYYTQHRDEFLKL